jgi:glycosyltransferase involved in cell wall biosynthesis
MTLSKPLVSVCIPTRNRAASLRESLKTILGQDYSPLEIVISDNCSDDDTPQVVEEWMRQDKRIRYVRHGRNIGLHENHNFCFDSARGEFVCIWHDHDEHAPDIVSEYVSFFEQHPRVGVVCSDWDLINDAGERIGVREHKVKAVTPGLAYIGQTIRSGRTSVGIPGAMVRASALGASRFVPDAPIGFGDFPLWFRVAEKWDVGHISKRLWSWRQNAQSHSARTIVAIAHDYHQNLDQYCDEHLVRWPEHARLVDEWRVSIRRYLFWALTYEVALHFRNRKGKPERQARSLFEIMNYSLTPEQFHDALVQMEAYRTGVTERVAFAAVRLLIRCHLASSLAWLTRHQSRLRALLRLE